jgi:hypothetical protein
MSEENVKLARRFYEVLNAEGFNNSENPVHADIEFIDSPTLPDASHYVGEAAVRGFAEEAMERGWTVIGGSRKSSTRETRSWSSGR